VADQAISGQTATQNLLCEQQDDESAVMQKLSYVYPFASQTQMPSKIVSSALDKQYFDDDQSETAPVIVQDDKNKVGTAYHTVYQFVPYDADVKGITNTIQSLVAEGKIDEQYACQLDVNLIYNTLQNPQLKDILNGGKVYHEIPFMLYAPYDQLAKDKRFSDNVMLQGVIDLLVIGDNKATVVDFKFTSRSDKVAERYPYQLNSYKLAVKQICGIECVDAYVLSIADNKLIKM
jgi:ATP-dependent exoDNAse (exonuclease V) beta subunit